MSVVSREKIVALSLDIEDKEKVISLLSRKLEVAQSQLSDIDDSVSQRYQRITQEKAEEHKRLSDELSSETQMLMQQKAELIKSCKELMQQIQDTDRDMQAEVRGVYREGEELIESERKIFKQGYDERLAKFMALKAQEYKESTNRAMDPEFKRLEALQEHDITRLKLDLENEERHLQETIKQRWESLKEEEKKATKEEIRFILRAIQDKCSKDLEELAQEFKQRNRSSRIEFDRQLDKHQRQLKDKAAKFRRDRHQELNEVHDLGQERLVVMKQKHVELVQKMTKDHEQKIRTFKHESEDEKKRLELQFYQSQQAHNIQGSKSSPQKQQRSTPRSRPLYRPTFDDDYDRREEQKLAENEEGSFSPSRNNNKSNLSLNDLHSDSVLTPAQREELARLREEHETQRDQQLQSLIRSLEVETLKMEREWKQRMEKEEKKINELTSKEHEQLSRRLRQVNDDTADFVVEREQLLRTLQEEKQREEQLQADLQHLKKEISIYEDGISAQRGRLQDKTQQHQLALRGLQLEYAPQFRDLQQEIEHLEQQLAQYAQQWENDQQELENQHAMTLAGLDRQVKENVSQLDVEILQLKDEIEEEKVIQERLRVHLARYGGSKNVQDNILMAINGEIKEEEDEGKEEELHVTKRRPMQNNNSSVPQSSVRSRIVSRRPSGNNNGGCEDTDDQQTVRTTETQRTASTASHTVGTGLRSSSGSSKKRVNSLRK